MVTTSSNYSPLRRATARRVRSQDIDPRESILRARPAGSAVPQLGTYKVQNAGKLSLLQQRVSRMPSVPPATTPNLSASELDTDKSLATTTAESAAELTATSTTSTDGIVSTNSAVDSTTTANTASATSIASTTQATKSAQDATSTAEPEMPALVQMASRSLELGTALPLFHGSELPYVSVGQRIHLQLTSSLPHQEPSKQLDAHVATQQALEQVKNRILSPDVQNLSGRQDNFAQIYAPLQQGAQQLVWREPQRALSINLVPFPYMHAQNQRVQRLFAEVGGRFNEHLTSLLLLSKGQQLEQELHNWVGQEFMSLEAVQAYPQLSGKNVRDFFERADPQLNQVRNLHLYLGGNPHGLELAAKLGVVDPSLLARQATQPHPYPNGTLGGGVARAGVELGIQGQNVRPQLRMQLETLAPAGASTANLPLMVAALQGDMYLDAQLTALHMRASSYYPQELGQLQIPRVSWELSKEVQRRLHFLLGMPSGTQALRAQQFLEHEVSDLDKNYAFFMGSTLRLANRRMLEVAEYSVLTRALIARVQANTAYLVNTNQLSDIVNNGLTYRKYIEAVFQTDDVDFQESEATREPLDIVFDDGHKGITKDVPRAAYQEELDRLKHRSSANADAGEKKTIEPPSAHRTSLGGLTGGEILSNAARANAARAQAHLDSLHNHEEPNSPQHQAYDNLEVGLLEHGDALSLSRDSLADHGIVIPKDLESTYQAVQEQRDWERKLSDFQQSVAHAVDQALQSGNNDSASSIGWDTKIRLAQQVRPTWEPLAHASFSAQTQANSFHDLDLQRENWELEQSLGLLNSASRMNANDAEGASEESGLEGRFVPDLYRNLESVAVATPSVARHWLVPRAIWSRTYTPQVLEQLVYIREAAQQAEARLAQEYLEEQQREALGASVVAPAPEAHAADAEVEVFVNQLTQQVQAEWQGTNAQGTGTPSGVDGASDATDTTVTPLAEQAVPANVVPANNFPTQATIAYSAAARPTMNLRADLSGQVSPAITLNQVPTPSTDVATEAQADAESEAQLGTAYQGEDSVIEQGIEFTGNVDADGNLIAAAVQGGMVNSDVASSADISVDANAAPAEGVEVVDATSVAFDVAKVDEAESAVRAEHAVPAVTTAEQDIVALTSQPHTAAHSRRDVRLAVLAASLRERALRLLETGNHSVIDQAAGLDFDNYDTPYWNAKAAQDDSEVWLALAEQQLVQEETDLSDSLSAVNQLTQEVADFIEQHQDGSTSYVSYLPSLVRVAPQVLFLGDMTVHSASKLAAQRSSEAGVDEQDTVGVGVAATGSAHALHGLQAGNTNEFRHGVDISTIADAWMEDALRALARKQLQAELGQLGQVTIQNRLCIRPLPELDCALVRNLPNSLVQARAQALASSDLSFQLKVRQELALYLWNQPQMTLAQYHATRAQEVVFPASLSAAQREFYVNCYTQLRDEIIHADQEFTLERKLNPALSAFWEEVGIGNEDFMFEPRLHHLRVQQRIGLSGKPSEQHALLLDETLQVAVNSAEVMHDVNVGDAASCTAQPQHFALTLASHNGLTCWWFAQVRSYFPFIHNLRKYLVPQESKAGSTPSQQEFVATPGVVDPQGDEYRHHQATTLQAQRFWCLNNHLPIVQEQGQYVTIMSGLNFARSSRLFYRDYELGMGYAGADLGLAYYSNLEPIEVDGMYYDLNWYQPSMVELFWSTTHPELQYHRLNLLYIALDQPATAVENLSLASLLWNYIGAGAAARRCAVRGEVTQPAWLSNFKVAYPNKVGMYKSEADTTYMVIEPSTFHHKWEGVSMLVEVAFERGRYQRPSWYFGASSDSLRWAGNAQLALQMDTYAQVQREQLVGYYGIHRAEKIRPTTQPIRSFTAELGATVDLGVDGTISSTCMQPTDVTEE